MTWINSWVPKAVVAKGQFHCHSTNSDGHLSPSEVMNAYKTLGYDFVNLSDHNVNTTDPGVSGITFIPGCEETNGWGHLGTLNMATHVSPIDSPYKNTIYANCHAYNGFTIFNHPIWASNPMSLGIMMATEFDAVEYLNGFRYDNVNNCPPGNCNQYSCMPIPRVMCDALWTMGRRFWLTAGDDTHDFTDDTCPQRNNTWDMVNSEDTTAENLVANIQAGNYYISDGAEISNVSVSGSAITVTTPVSSNITFQVQGAVIAQTNNGVTTATYTAAAGDIYVLIRVVKASDTTKQAFAQPIFNDAARPACFQSKEGSFTNPATTGNHSYTGVGFRPRAIITWITPITMAWGTDSQFAIGVGAEGAAGYSAFAGQHGVATSREYRKMAGSTVAGMIQYDGSVICEGTLASLDADGFTINWTTANATAFTFHYLALGGHRLMQASMALHTQKATTGTLAVTGIPFKPDCLFTIADVTTAGSSSVTSVIMLGAADASGNMWAQYNYAQSGVTTTNTGRSQRTDCCIYGTGLGPSAAYKATLQSLDDNGFTLNYLTTDGNTTRQFLTLCLKGGGYQVGAWDKSTAAAPTTDTINVTGTGTTLTPSSVFATTWSHIASTSGVAGMRVTIGASDGTNYHTSGVTNKNASTTGTVVRKFGTTNETLIVADNDTGTSEAVGIIGSFDVGSFQASWPVTNNATATQICYIAFGQLDVTTAAVTATSTLSANTTAANVTTTTQNSAVATFAANTTLVDVRAVAPSATSTFKADLYSSVWNAPFYRLTVPANGTLDVGPFDEDMYSKIRFTHSILDVTMQTMPGAAIIPFLLFFGGPLPTYYPVNSTDYVRLNANTFMHFYNDSAVNDAVVYYIGSGACQAASVLAGEELILGPFDIAGVGCPTLTLTHTYTADVTMAALTTLSVSVTSPQSVSVTSPQRVDCVGDQTFHFINTGGTADIITIQPVYCP